MAEENGRVCVVCGKKFVTDDKRRKYCSAKCVKEAHEAQVARYRSKKRAEKKKLVKICAWCGKEFEARNESAKYCNDACFKLARAAKAHEKYMAMLQTPEGIEKIRKGAQNREAKMKICAMCGKEFEAKNPVTKYCSDECRKKAARIHAAQWKERIMETPEGREKFMERTKMYTETQKAKPEYVEKYKAKLGKIKENYRLKKDNGWTKKCAYCKNWFAGAKGMKYCSDECREAAEKEKEALMVGARTSDRICANCGKPLPAGRQQYCSDECRRNAANLKRIKNKYIDGRLREVESQISAQAVINQRTADSFALAASDLAATKAELKNDIKLEAERRCCGDNAIVTYTNATFYPKQVADVTTGTATTA